MRTSLRTLTALALSVPLALAAATPADAARKPRSSADTAAPSVSIASPTSGSAVSSAPTVVGSASDNTGVASVWLAVDGGLWRSVSGTTSWALALSGLAAGGHTVTARATDAAGNAATASVSFTVASTSPSPSPSPTATASPSPSPSPTTSPSPSPTPTTSTSPSPSPSPTSSTSSGSAPSTQGSWTSPEGVRITVSSAGPWTIAKVYGMLLANARDLDKLGPRYTINVQDQYASMTSTTAGESGGVYTDFLAVTNLQGVSSTFAAWPDYVLTHEFGIAWAQYHRYMDHGGSWSSYLDARWANADGSLRLAQDSRLNSTLSWRPAEIISDDYRLLFGSSAAISQRPTSVNTSIPDPRNQPGLATWLLGTWA